MTFSPIRQIAIEEADIQEQSDYLENALKNAELVRVNTYEAYLRFTDWVQFDKIGPLLDFDEEITCDVLDGNIMKIEMKGHLPFIKREHKHQAKEYYGQLRDHYIPRINKAITKRNPNIKFDRAFVLIVQYFPNNSIKDLDNQFKSFIFNSLRFTQIVKGDSWQALSYIDDAGMDKENPRTEIYVSSRDNIQRLLEYLPAND